MPARILMPMKVPEWLLWIAGGYGAMLVAVTLLQQRMLYLPQRARVDEMVTADLRPWPAPDDVRGLVAEPPGAPRTTAVVFHGNAGHAGHRDFYASALTGLGLRVILAEYPGYGHRSGKVGENAFVADAKQTIALARRLHGGPLLLIGESLGVGVAAGAIAHRADDVAGLLAITPWDSLEHVAAHHYRWLPVKWLLRDRYDSARHLAAFEGPVLVAVAERDSIVPPRFGRALYESLGGPKRLVVMPAADHNDWMLRVDRAWWQSALAFLLEPGTRP